MEKIYTLLVTNIEGENIAVIQTTEKNFEAILKVSVLEGFVADEVKKCQRYNDQQTFKRMVEDYKEIRYDTVITQDDEVIDQMVFIRKCDLYTSSNLK